MQRTREANEIDAATSSLALERDATGQYSVDSPIQHLKRDADGAVRVAATTSTDDIQQALGEVEARHQAQAPSQDAQQRQAQVPIMHDGSARPAPRAPASAQSSQQQDMHPQAMEQQRQWQLQQEQQSQLQLLQQQQREKRAEDEKTREAQREEAQVATATENGERAPPSPDLLPYSDPAHPRHALYADVQERMQKQGHDFSEERLTQITAALNESYFKPGWKGEFYVARDTVYAASYDHPLGLACLPIHEPAPSIQASMQVAQAGDLEHARINQIIAQDRLQAQSQAQSQPGMGM
ncbi:hypothetical protein EBN15_12985 [Xanthomonas cucurbitae]|nr:hypothetical protein EBN15_12985 [Xanthomonas cucurbitae]